MYPWRDGAGNVRVALSVVVLDSGGGGRVAHAVAGKRLAALGHFWHGGEVMWCVAVASERRMYNGVALSWRLCQCHASEQASKIDGQEALWRPSDDDALPAEPL